MSVIIRTQLLPYNDRLERRETSTLETVVLHCTELPTLAMAREYGERVIYGDGTGNSGHYYIDRDGAIYCYVSDDRVARHVIGHNKASLGIEIVNTGRFPRWFSKASQTPAEPYAAEQIEALRQLLMHLKKAHPSLIRLARHSDLDTQMIPAEDDTTVLIRRKIDPGPMFPWEQILRFWQSL